ncbi:MAG: hypothetical protein V4548_03580 [Bacteroidota bacterium]
MEFKYNNWTMFVNEGATFSETFREQMAFQLLNQFYLTLGVTDQIKNHKFRLHVGLAPLKTIYKDNHAFALVDIINPISISTKVTAYWKLNIDVNVENAPQLNVWNEENIEFSWCTDFEVNDYLQYLESRNIISKEQLDSNFDYEYDYALYPDVCCTICFSQKVYKTELTEIESILTETIKNSYISDLKNENEQMKSNKDNETIVMFDFQNNDFEKSKRQLEEAIKKIGQSKVGKLIDKIIIE